MDTARILEELRAEKDRIEKAISAFLSIHSGGGTRRGRPHKFASSSSANGRRRRNRLTPAGRRRLSQMMKKRWAERKKKGKTSL
jgi:hypothetical protein